jgi:hypothetical protein
LGARPILKVRPAPKRDDMPFAFCIVRAVAASRLRLSCSLSVSKQNLRCGVVNLTYLSSILAIRRQDKSYWLSFCLRLLCGT